MLFHSVQLNFNTILLLLVGIYCRVEIGAAYRCYVCGGETNLSCDKFDPHNESFIENCPADVSCLISTDVGSTLTTRSCSDTKGIRDCRIINFIKYCYCTEDLCNKITNYHTDDEDFPEEGSGTSVITDTKQIEPKKTNVTNQSNHIHFYLYSFYIPLLTFLGV